MGSFDCPKCDKKLKFTDDHIGKKVACPRCCAVLRVPAKVVADQRAQTCVNTASEAATTTPIGNNAVVTKCVNCGQDNATEISLWIAHFDLKTGALLRVNTPKMAICDMCVSAKRQSGYAAIVGTLCLWGFLLLSFWFVLGLPVGPSSLWRIDTYRAGELVASRTEWFQPGTETLKAVLMALNFGISGVGGMALLIYGIRAAKCPVMACARAAKIIDDTASSENELTYVGQGRPPVESLDTRVGFWGIVAYGILICLALMSIVIIASVVWGVITGEIR